MVAWSFYLYHFLCFLFHSFYYLFVSESKWIELEKKSEVDMTEER